MVHWLDAVAGAGWTDNDEPYKPVEVLSVGFLVHESGASVTLATSIGDGGEHNGTMTIPKGMITCRAEL